MTKNIIFPVNNKGGVGKTSILTDLSFTLAQRHSVGVIDTDYQASLAGTLLGHQDLSCRDLDYYDNISVADVVLMGATHFSFNNKLSSMGLNVDETRAKLGVFPIGQLYDSPGKKERLEKIVAKEMGDVSFLAVDLPPIPHPSMILDYSIMPLVEILGGDVRLFPLIVSTPEHNVVDIGLRQWKSMAKYFDSRGVSSDRVFPVSVLNKIPLKEGREDGKVVFYHYIDEYVSKKLGALGILHVPKSKRETYLSGINHFNKGFEFEGKRFRSVAFPFLSSIKDGRFSLLWGEEPDLHHYPHLVDLAMDNRYEVPALGNDIERIYLFALRELVNYIVAKSGEKPKRNYTKRKVNFDLREVTSEAVRQLRDCLNRYYVERIQKPESEIVTIPKYCTSTKHQLFAIPKTISLEQIADVVVMTIAALNPGTSVNRKEVIKGIESQHSINQEGPVYINYHSQINSIILGFLRAPWDYKNPSMEDIGEYRKSIDIFLNNLDKAFEKAGSGKK